MADEPKSAASEVADAASQTLSQLLARILDQLSLSAWLPSAALTLMLGFTLELASSLDVMAEGKTKKLASDPGAALAYTFRGLGKLSIGSLILMVIVIVILTMLTQAFAFGAIRFMEGYWGVNPVVEAIAAWNCRRHQRKYNRLDKRRNRVRQRAWDAVADAIEREQLVLAGNNRRREYTTDMIKAIGQIVTGEYSGEIRLTRKQRELVNAYDWVPEAPGDLLRRQLNLDMKLDDYPDELQHIMPMRLGNVLRKYEDDMEQDPVETFIDRVYDRLPFSMKMDHDEQRARLDLYCSMIFVLWLVAAISAIRLSVHWKYAAAVAGACVVGSRITYRAAITSARHYGQLLVTIAQHVRQVDDETSPDNQGSSTALG